MGLISRAFGAERSLTDCFADSIYEMEAHLPNGSEMVKQFRKTNGIPAGQELTPREIRTLHGQLCGEMRDCVCNDCVMN